MRSISTRQMKRKSFLHLLRDSPLLIRILVIEDLPELAKFTRQTLEQKGHGLDVNFDGDEGLKLADHVDYAMVLLEVCLAGHNLGMVEKLRRARSAPILMLTARNKVLDRLEGLRLDVDDYLVKPFSTV